MPEIDDAERLVAEMHGVENSWTGLVVVKLVRHVRELTRGYRGLEQRIAVLERAPAEAPTPPPPKQ